jgi:hypothetical protein
MMFVGGSWLDGFCTSAIARLLYWRDLIQIWRERPGAKILAEKRRDFIERGAPKFVESRVQ